ncbi:MAG: LytTR family transcriptional regulator [Ruminococcaceae bacterium]|nr:LytTR family transcriptional regulator [Oscillospiraceae bacterium]
MKITVIEIDDAQEEEIILRCHRSSAAAAQFLGGSSATPRTVAGTKDGQIYRLTLDDIYYFETVENKSFIYCKDAVYETRLKLYEFERLCQGSDLFRCSRSMVLNSGKIDHLSPSLSGRFEVTLVGGEKVIVSRQYVDELKKLIGM